MKSLLLKNPLNNFSKGVENQMKRSSKIVFIIAGGILLMVTFSVVKPVIVRAAKEVTATLVSDVDNPARHPFQANCFVTNSVCDITTVPANNELVIQGTTIRAFINPGTGAVDAYIATYVNGVLVGHYVGMQNLGPAIGLTGQPDEYIAVLPITLYSDPGTTVFMSVQRGFVGLESVTLSGTISGYTVSLP